MYLAIDSSLVIYSFIWFFTDKKLRSYFKPILLLLQVRETMLLPARCYVLKKNSFIWHPIYSWVISFLTFLNASKLMQSTNAIEFDVFTRKEKGRRIAGKFLLSIFRSRLCLLCTFCGHFTWHCLFWRVMAQQDTFTYHCACH